MNTVKLFQLPSKSEFPFPEDSGMPIVCTALPPTGSIQLSHRAQGLGLVTSGGSTPRWRQRTKPAARVRIRSRTRQSKSSSMVEAEEEGALLESGASNGKL